MGNRGFFQQTDFSFQVGSLNVRQAIRLGTELHNIKQAYLSYFKMEENKKFPQHYDVDFKLSAFTLKKGAAVPDSKKRKGLKKTSSSRQKEKNPSAIKGIESKKRKGIEVWEGGEREEILSQKDKKRGREKNRGKNKEKSRWMKDKKRDRGRNRLRGGEKKNTAPVIPLTKGQDIDQTPTIGRTNTREDEKKPLSLKIKNSVRDKDKEIDKEINRGRRTRPPIERNTENLPIIQSR